MGKTDKIVEDVLKPIRWRHVTPDDWQYWVGIHTQRVWPDLSLDQKIAVALDALEMMRAMA